MIYLPTNGLKHKVYWLFFMLFIWSIKLALSRIMIIKL